MSERLIDQTLSKLLQSNIKKTIAAANIVASPLPCTEDSEHPLFLYLLSEDYPKGRLDHDEMMAIINEPAYWAFCWASGQVLARHILAHSQSFAGKSVLDFGAGSGVVAIAAKLAGAQRVIACDIDPHSLDACAENAKLNNVNIELLADIYGLSGHVDMIIAADVLYDRDNFPWIDELKGFAKEIIIADSRVKSDLLNGYEIIDRITASTVPDLDEFKEFNDVRIYRSLN
jgi:predicted nicotinamide N-methyase